MLKREGIKNYDYFSLVSHSDIEANERLKEKLDFLGISQIRKETVSQLKEIFLKNSENILSNFYKRLHLNPYMHEIITKHTTDERLKQTFHLYMISLFDDDLDINYVFRRRSIAEVHARIGLTPDWMLSAYTLLNQLFIPLITSTLHRKPKLMLDAILAYESIITLDQQIVVETYMEIQSNTFISGLSDIITYNAEIDELKQLIEFQQRQKQDSYSVTTSVQELNASVEEVSASVSVVSQSSNEHLHELSGDIHTLQQISVFLKEVDDQQTIVQSDVRQLVDCVKNMEQVIEVIKNIAEQTNLLALNASIEAARAGEHGKGFSIVAEEVRKLADHTKGSLHSINEDMKQLMTFTSNISNVTQDASQRLHDGVEHTKNIALRLSELNNSLQKIGIQFQDIAQVTEEQAIATDSIAHKNHDIAEATELGENIAQRTGEAVYTLSKMIDQFRVTTISKNMRMSQEDLLQLAITDHLLWRWKVYNLILGYEKMNENDVSSHLDCRLGKWYYGMANKLFGHEKAYKEVEQPHIQIHQLAKEAVKAINQGNKERAEQILIEIHQVSKEVVEKLTILKNIIIQQKEKYRTSVHSRK